MKYLTIGLAVLACTHLAGRPAHADQFFADIGALIEYYDNNPTNLGGYVMFVKNNPDGSVIFVLVEVDFAGRAVAEWVYNGFGTTFDRHRLLNHKPLGDYIAVNGFSINGGSCGAMVACLGIGSLSI